MMTMHAAKGLEFDAVFLPGWEEGIFPHQKSIEEKGQNGLEEERRTCVCWDNKGKKKAIISFSMNRFYQGDWIDSMASRFIDELPEKNLEKNSFFDENKDEIEDFEFNQDFDFEDNVRSPGWIRYQKIKMIIKRLKALKKKFKSFGIDGYVVPQNDEFFSEYSKKDRLKIISNFSGSAGFAIILKEKNYLFVDGRYTLQAQIEFSRYFKIVNLEKILNCNLFRNKTLGIDPKIFTSNQLNQFFLKKNKVKIVENNLVDMIYKKISISRPFFSIKSKIAGQSHINKIKRLANLLKRQSSDYLFISAPENVAWLLNIRGYDNPNSPIPNCQLFFTSDKKYF